MTRKNVALREGTQAHLEDGVKMGLVDVDLGGADDPAEVVLFVKNGGESEFTLRLGDTFPVGEQTWKVDRIEEIGRNGVGATFVRVE